jgi:hypothetical protein
MTRQELWTEQTHLALRFLSGLNFQQYTKEYRGKKRGGKRKKKRGEGKCFG